MFISYFKSNLAVAMRSAWQSTNGLAGAAIGGLGLVWPGVISFSTANAKWAELINWLASFAVYSVISWFLLFIFYLIFVAPYVVWKNDLSKRPNTDKDNEAAEKRLLEIREHDRRLAAKVREIFPEARKQKLFSDLYNQHAYWDKQGNALSEVLYYLDSAEAHFLNERLNLLSKKFVQAGANLLDFMGLKFFIYPRERHEGPLMFAMQPGWNVDREGNGSPEQDEKYSALTKDLEDLLSKMSDTYDEFIRAFHSELLV